MPGQPCANHPAEVTFVRCGRCEKPICTRCMVDSPVGKKCRDCARNRTHLSESTPRQVILAWIAATAVAIPAGWVAHFVPIPLVVPFVYGALVGEVALRAGQRSRSLAIQVAAGTAALLGVLIGSGLVFLPFQAMAAGEEAGPWAFAFALPLLMLVIGVPIAVSRVRYL